MLGLKVKPILTTLGLVAGAAITYFLQRKIGPGNNLSPLVENLGYYYIPFTTLTGYVGDMLREMKKYGAPKSFTDPYPSEISADAKTYETSNPSQNEDLELKSYIDNLYNGMHKEAKNDIIYEEKLFLKE